MKKETEKQKVLAFIKSCYPKEVAGIEIEAWALTGWQMKASTAERRCRELVNEGYLERLGKKFVAYKYIPRENRQMSADEILKMAIQFSRHTTGWLLKYAK